MLLNDADVEIVWVIGSYLCKCKVQMLVFHKEATEDIILVELIIVPHGKRRVTVLYSEHTYYTYMFRMFVAPSALIYNCLYIVVYVSTRDVIISCYLIVTNSF